MTLYAPGCGGRLEKISQPCALRSAAGEPADIEITQDVPLSLPTGFGKVLKKGSRWKSCGVVDTGVVYRPMNVAFTFPAQWQHEAFLIISQESLVGFYFPVEDLTARRGGTTLPSMENGRWVILRLFS